MSTRPMKPVLTDEDVDAIIAGGRARAAELGVAATIVVTDDTATPRALLRVAGADLLTAGLASGKAQLSAANGMPTHAWRGIVAADPFLGAVLPTALDRLLGGAVFFGGGYPVRIGGVTVGGIGVSGGSEEADDDVARAALAAVRDAEPFAVESA